MIINDKEQLYYEKYRPQRIQDMILPDEIKTKLQHQVDTKNLSNMLFSSFTPGTGKTSCVNAIAKESGLETLFLNASLNNGIDSVRTTIQNFASYKSFDDNHKIVIMDECDGYSDSAQQALRGFIEEFSGNCRFILTCNYINKIIPAIINRFEVYDFDEFYNQSNRESLIKQIFNRLCFILDTEKVSYDKKDLIPIINTYYPSVRGMVGFIQKSVINNTLKVDLTQIQKLDGFDNLILQIKNKNFDEILKETYLVTNPDSFYTYMYKNLNQFNQQARPQILLTIAKYQFQSSNVRDKNLTLSACCVELANFIK